jgi:hypothetical protein
MPSTIARREVPREVDPTTQKKRQARLVTIPSRRRQPAPKPRRNSLRRPRRAALPDRPPSSRPTARHPASLPPPRLPGLNRLSITGGLGRALHIGKHFGSYKRML